MKKFLVLFVLFALPICAYIFFSSSVDNFIHLPILTKNVSTLDEFTSLDGGQVKLDGQISILLICGDNIRTMGGNAYRLNDQIYRKIHNFKEVRFLIMAENGTQKEAHGLLKKLDPLTDTSSWEFAFGTSAAIQSFFDSLKTDLKLNKHKSTPYAFIIDKERNLRGRNGTDNPDIKNQYGYDTRSVSTLKKQMLDDVKVLLAEYSLALRKKTEK